MSRPPRREDGPRAAKVASRLAERTLRASWIEGERRRRPLRLLAAPAPATTSGSGTGTRASTRSSGGASSPSGRACELDLPAQRRHATTASSATRSSGTAPWTCAGAGPTTSPRATRPTPRPSSRRCWPGPGGSRSATPPTSRAIAAHHRWLEANRDLDGDGLLWIVQPDESGLDSSPKFDPVWGRRAHAHLGFIALIQRNRRREWDARRILDDGGPLLCEVVVNVLWCLARLAAGEPSITPGADRPLLGRAAAGLFLDVARGEIARERRDRPGRGDHRVRTSTWSALAPLALPDLPEEIGRRLVEEHLLDAERYWTPVPAALGLAAGAELRAARLGDVFVRRYWRGPTWINSAWLLWLGLRRLGYDERGRPDGGRRSARPTRARARASSTSRSPARAWARASSAGPR